MAVSKVRFEYGKGAVAVSKVKFEYGKGAVAWRQASLKMEKVLWLGAK